MLLSNCGVEEDSYRVPWSARRSHQSILKEITLNTHWKDWCWGWSFNNLANWCKQLTRWKRPWCWERLKAKGEEGSRGWNDQIASLIRWTWTWANSRRQWGTGRPGALQSVGSQRVRHDLAIEQEQQHSSPKLKSHFQNELHICFLLPDLSQSVFIFPSNPNRFLLKWNPGLSLPKMCIREWLSTQSHQVHLAKRHRLWENSTCSLSLGKQTLVISLTYVTRDKQEEEMIVEKSPGEKSQEETNWTGLSWWSSG